MARSASGFRARTASTSAPAASSADANVFWTTADLGAGGALSCDAAGKAMIAAKAPATTALMICWMTLMSISRMDG
jgi:hypothetical protein